MRGMRDRVGCTFWRFFWGFPAWFFAWGITRRLYFIDVRMPFVELESRICEHFDGILLQFFFTLGTVVDPMMRSSKYNPHSISHTLSGYVALQILRCSWMIPPNRKGEGSKSSSAWVKCKVSNWECSLGFQWNLNVSLSQALILTCRNVFCKSLVISTGWKRLLNDHIPQLFTFPSWFCSGGPGCKQSLREGTSMWALADASYTTHNFVLSAASHITAICGM